MISGTKKRLKAGSRVDHPRFGEGRVLGLIGRRYVRVSFDKHPSLPRTVSVAELVSGGAASAAQTVPAPPSAPVSLSLSPEGFAPLERSEAWQSLEALRLGVVPSTGTLHYTVGRDNELARVRGLLGDDNGFLAVFGDYGHGKTHLLDAAEQIARESGYATARLTVDPTEIAIQNPARIWGALARRLQFDGDLGLTQVLERFRDSPAHASPDGERASPFLTPCVWAQQSGSSRLRSLALDHVHAEKIDIQRYRKALAHEGWQGDRVTDLPDYRTMGRVYVYLMGTLASWIRDIGGKGLLVILDEVERVDALTAQDRYFAMECQKHLAQATIPAEQLGFDAETLYIGGHARHRSLPARFEENQPLSVLTAMTPLESTLESFAEITMSEQHSVRLREPGEAEVRLLVGRIAGLYGLAYPAFKLPPDLLTRMADHLVDSVMMGEASFRSAVRRSVAALDHARLSER